MSAEERNCGSASAHHVTVLCEALFEGYLKMSVSAEQRTVRKVAQIPVRNLLHHLQQPYVFTAVEDKM